jgi:pantothenate kinase
LTKMYSLYIINAMKAQRLQNNCLKMMSKVADGSWAYNFWSKTYQKLVKKYGKQARLN